MSDEDKVYEEFEDYCKEVTAAAIAWEAKWPNACKSCDGRGGHGWTEMHGFSHGAGEQMYDICSCVEAGNCPRCGATAWSDDNEIETPCPTCGWNWCKGSDDACPEI